MTMTGAPYRAIPQAIVYRHRPVRCHALHYQPTNCKLATVRFRTGSKGERRLAGSSSALEGLRFIEQNPKKTVGKNEWIIKVNQTLLSLDKNATLSILRANM